jgi:hypothetical protein
MLKNRSKSSHIPNLTSGISLFTSWKRAPGINWIGGWMRSRPGLDAVVNARNRNPVVQHATGHLTDHTVSYATDSLDIKWKILKLSNQICKHVTQWNRVFFSDANRVSAGQEIPRLILKQKVHCLIHKSAPYAPILSQMHAIHTFLSGLSKIHFNITISCACRSSGQSF